ncbi:MAG: PLDc N-terminal domain-containing protein, partial [Methanosarcinaceae archaeon]
MHKMHRIVLVIGFLTAFAIMALSFTTDMFFCVNIIVMTLFVIYTVIVVVAFGFLIGMFIDCLQRPSERFPDAGEYDKLIWCFAIFFVNFVGAVMYYFLVYR